MLALRSGPTDRIQAHPATSLPLDPRRPSAGIQRRGRPPRAAPLVAALACLLALLPGALPVASADASQTLVQFQGPTQWIEIAGRGYGHAVGMCQWGARGRALAGQHAEEILRAYYQGTSLERLVAPDLPVRVLVQPGYQPAPDQPARVVARGGTWRIADLPPLFGPDAAVEIAAVSGSPAGRYRVVDARGVALHEGTLTGALRLQPGEPGTRFEVQHKRAAANVYRGEISLVVKEQEGEQVLLTVNQLGLDDYLRGVVPAEMPSSWPVEALKAQVLAARTYAVQRARAAQTLYDLDDTEQSQVYRGVRAEVARVNELIDQTSGLVITYQGRPIGAYFSSTCAGASESNENVWAGPPLPYLRGIADVDPSGRPYDADSPRFQWTSGPLTVGELEEILKQEPSSAVGRVSSLDLSQRAPSGRLTRIRATGTEGTRTMSASTFRAMFGRNRPEGVQPLLSSWFEIRFVPPPASSVRAAPSAEAAPTPLPGSAPVAAPPTPTALPRSLEHTAPAPPLPPGTGIVYFPQTGHNITAPFLQHFQERGGVDLFGLPRTEALQEDGQTVQYLQRARLEYHPELADTPYEVQPTLLGDLLTTGRSFPQASPFPGTDEHWYYPETGYGVHYAFLAFFQRHGGIDTFGYPTSEELREGGFTVQYFQRARFEYHPELPEPYRVSLGLLGDEYLIRRGWLR